MNKVYLQGQLEKALPFILGATLFFIPISPSLKGIFLILSVCCVLLIPSYRKLLATVYFDWWNLGALLLFVFFVLSCLWSAAPHSEQFSELNKYSKLLYLPFLAVAFIQPKARTLGLHAFLAAMLLTLILSCLKAKGWITYHHDEDPGHIFHQHIITGFLMAYAGYVSAVLCYQNWGASFRFGYLLLALLFGYDVLFINTGRTGYILYFVLVVLFCVQVFNLKKALLAVIGVCALFAISYDQSAVMRTGVDYLISDYKNYQHNKKDTSLGFRLQFHDYAKSLFAKHPVAGLGTAGFRYQFSQDNPIPDWGPVLLEPHSQYWLIATEQGTLGLILFGLFLGLFFLAALKMDALYRELMLGLVAIFCMGCWSDSLLFYAGTGYQLLAMGALFIGGMLAKNYCPGKAVSQEHVGYGVKTGLQS